MFNCLGLELVNMPEGGGEGRVPHANAFFPSVFIALLGKARDTAAFRGGNDCEKHDAVAGR
jgi:hypothetical protein